MHCTPLGDQAILAYCIDEAAAAILATQLRHAPAPWLIDVVQSYASVCVFFDLLQVSSARVVEHLQVLDLTPTEHAAPTARLHRIPCCYERQLDLQRVSEQTGLPTDEVIRLHSTTEYIVYAIGFCPGFPYLGYLPPALSGVPRLTAPRVRVEAGSVGLTGRQTGIYTEGRPGGWNIVGRTPLELVNVEDEYFPLRTGDRVRFVRIDEAEFTRLCGQRL